MSRTTSLCLKGRILILVARGYEETDVSTIARSLRRTGMPVAVVGLKAGPVRGAYGLSLAPDLVLSEVEGELHRAIILPGGAQATRRFEGDPRVHALVRRTLEGNGYVLAIGTAHTALCSAGILDLGASPPFVGAPASASGGDAVHRDGEWMPYEGVLVRGQVVLGRDSASAQEAVLALVALLRRGA